MTWIKKNWVWLACIAVGALGLFFFSGGPDKSESLEKARAEKERLRLEREEAEREAERIAQN